MGARSGAGAGFRGSIRAGLMSGLDRGSMGNWNSAIQSTIGSLAAGVIKGPYHGQKPTKLTGAAKKNAQETLKQLMAIHPTSNVVKNIKAGKYVGLDTSFL